MPAWLQRDWCSSFVLALGHFVWQGTLIAVVLAIALRATKAVAARYWSSLAALLLMAACPIVTLGWLMQPESRVVVLDAPLTVREESAPSPPMIPTAPAEATSDVGHVSNVPARPPVPPLDFATAAVATPAPQPPDDNRSWWQTFAPQLTIAYLCGVALMLLRLVFGLWGGRRLRRRVHWIDDPSLLAAMRRQATALGLKLLPVLAYCERVTVPTVVGVLKPMILLPLTLTSGLSPEQMESVLAHELAHLRRCDHLVNLLQRVIESLLFFHPVMWWVSHRIRDEREHCCDDLVVACGAMPLDYAKSLLVVAELSRASQLRRSVAAVSLLATGDRPSNLRQRIARLLGESATPSLRVSPRALLLAIGIPVVAVIATIQSGASHQPSRSTLDMEPSENLRAGDGSHAGRGSPDPALNPTAGLPNSDDGQSKTDNTNNEQSEVKVNPRDSTRLLKKRLSTDQPARTLELIYVLRQYRVFSRDEEWAQAIRELTRIGQPALPELIAELDRTDRDAMLRSLGIALRAMNDPRAVPALIRAIPKTLRPAGSDCGMTIRDPDLREFMLSNELRPDRRDKSVSVNRPVNEILDALERLTGHHFPEGDDDPLRHIFLGAPETRTERLKPFEERQTHWRDWWTEHGKEFVAAAELRTLEQPAGAAVIGKDGQDNVDRAGTARFGSLFPTGADVRLGPVHDVELSLQSYADAPTHLDFDDHRTLRMFEGSTDRSESHLDWIIRSGADVLCGANLLGYDTRVWLIENERWDTIDREVAQPSPLKLGVETRGGMMLLKPDQKTLLFTTREGGSGVLRLDPYNRATGSRGIHYRMWLTETAIKEVPPPAVPKIEVTGAWDAAVKVALQSPGAGKKCAWSLPDKESVALAADISLENLRQRLWGNDEQLDAWKRDHKITFIAAPTKHVEEGRGEHEELSLLGFDCISYEVRPQAFTEMSVAMATQILSETRETKLRTANSFVGNPSGPQPQTRLFLLADGTIGLLQITKADKKQDVLEFQYKLARIQQRNDENANASGEQRLDKAAESEDPRGVQRSVPGQSVDPAKELAAFQGTWCFDVLQFRVWPEPIGIGTDSNGRKSEKRWVVQGDQITWISQEGRRISANFTIDPTKTPKQIDFTFINGAHHGAKCLGIYEPQQGNPNYLWLCLTNPGSNAPRPLDVSYSSTKQQSMIGIYPVAPPQKPSVAKALERLQGVWQMELCDSTTETFGGTQQEASKWQWTIKGNEILWSRQDRLWKMKFDVDPTKSPNEIDLTYLVGPFKGQKCQGMYVFGGVDGQTLMISIQDPGSQAPRPKDISMRGGVKTSLIFLRPSEPSDIEREIGSFQGTWTLRNFDTGGKNKDPSSWPLPNGKGPDASGAGSELRWTVKGQEITWTSRAGEEIKASFTIDSRKSPMQIDLTFLSGPHKGETCPGIYQRGDLDPGLYQRGDLLDENILWLCLADPGSKTARPKSFSYRWGEGRSLLSLYPSSPESP